MDQNSGSQHTQIKGNFIKEKWQRLISWGEITKKKYFFDKNFRVPQKNQREIDSLTLSQSKNLVGPYPITNISKRPTYNNTSKNVQQLKSQQIEASLET